MHSIIKKTLPQAGKGGCDGKLRAAGKDSSTCEQDPLPAGCRMLCCEQGLREASGWCTRTLAALRHSHIRGGAAILWFPAPRNLCTKGCFQAEVLLRNWVWFPSLGLRNTFQGRDEGRSARRGTFSKTAAVLGRMVPAPREDGVSRLWEPPLLPTAEQRCGRPWPGSLVPSAHVPVPGRLGAQRCSRHITSKIHSCFALVVACGHILLPGAHGQGTSEQDGRGCAASSQGISLSFFYLFFGLVCCHGSGLFALGELPCS